MRISRFGPVLQVSPACDPANYDQVVSDTNLKIIEALKSTGVTSPVQNISVQVQDAAGAADRAN